MLTVRETRLLRAQAAMRVPAVRNYADPAARSPYDGASQTRRTMTFRAPTTTPNQSLGSLPVLRDRSRAAYRNNAYAKSIIDKLVSNIIGTGITPLWKSTLPEFKKAAAALWLRWTDESDADGLLDFYGQQTQACRAWLEAGEVFVRFRPRTAADGLSVPLQIQVLEPEMCPHTYDTTLANGNRVRAGIEFDAIGKRVAYYFYASRPGNPEDFDTSQLRRIPAEFVTHIYDPVRAGQLRGLPILTPTLISLYEIDKINDIVLMRHQLGNLFVGFVKTDRGVGETDINPVTGGAMETDETGAAVMGMEPGVMQTLDPNTEMQFSQPPDPAGTYPDFIKHQLRASCASVNVPYEIVTGDMKDLNDRTVRVILLEFRRRMMALQHQVMAHQFCRRVMKAWTDRVFLSGAIPMPVSYISDPLPFTDVTWQPHTWAYIQPVQDIQAKADAIRDGLSSRSAEVAETGESAESIDQQQAEDNARADSLGLKYDSDGRYPKTASVVTTPPADASPEAAPTAPTEGVAA